MVSDLLVQLAGLVLSLAVGGVLLEMVKYIVNYRNVKVDDKEE